MERLQIKECLVLNGGKEIMTLLSICIPNYNRVEELKRLVVSCVNTIHNNNLYEQVEICISDDCSSENPKKVIDELILLNPQVHIFYESHSENRGMDWNFYDSVMMSHGKYAWIIGNDDVPTKDGIVTALDYIIKIGDADFIVSPFDSISENGTLIKTTYPVKNGEEFQVFYTDRDLDALLEQTIHNCSLFDFLSNVIFKRNRWIEHGDMFADKMNSIFIQVYMNIQSVIEGAKYCYIPQKLVVQYLDDETNTSIMRRYKIFKGLYEAIGYFFSGSRKELVINKLADTFCARELFDDDVDEEIKLFISSVSSPMSVINRKYYVSKTDRKRILDGKTVYIYGAGQRGKKVYEDLINRSVVIQSFVDESKEKQRTGYMGKSVIGRKEFSQRRKEDDYIVVSVANIDVVYDVLRFLHNTNVEDDRILFM